MSEFIAGIDIGTSSVKILCISREGYIVSENQSYGLNPVNADVLDPSFWWNSIKKGFMSLSKKMDLSKIKALSLSSQVGTYVLFNNEEDETKLKAVSWNFPGGERQLRDLTGQLDEAFFQKHISMIHPNLVSYPAPRILMFQEFLHDEFDKVSKILQPKDYLYHKITGIFASDPFTWRGLANLHDFSFHRQLLDVIGMDNKMLPQLFKPSDSPSKLLNHIAEELGLNEQIPVYIGCNDFFASLIGMGVLRKNQYFDMTGTSEHIGMILEKPVNKPELVSGPYINDYICYGVTGSSGSSMAWGMENFADKSDNTIDLYGLLKAPQGSLPPLFLPYLKGERSPIWDLKARGTFFGLDTTHQSKHLLYSIMEGVAFSLFHIWGYLSQHVNTEIRVAGGASFDKGLNTIKASLFKVPFAVMKEKDTAALGAAMFAAIGSGWFNSLDESVDAWVKIDHVVYPDSRFEDILDSRFKVYRKLYPALKDMFELWNDCGGGCRNGF